MLNYFATKRKEIDREKDKKSTKKARYFSDGNVFPVLPASKLLANPERKEIVGKIQELTHIPKQAHKKIYGELIERFVEFVQILPATKESRLGSLMDEGLLRGLFVLEMEEKEDFNPLLMFAKFSAMLLVDVGQVVTDRTIIICDKEGGFVREWSVFNGAMQVLYENFYKMRHGGGLPHWVTSKIVLLLAREIIPSVAFNWLASDPQIFSMWLALLLDDKENAGAFALMYQRVVTRLDEFRNTDGYIIHIDAAISNPVETRMGEEFLQWLKNYIRKSKDVNNPSANIHILHQGVVVRLGGLVRKFSSEKGRKVSAVTIGNQLRKMGVSQGKVKLIPIVGEKRPGLFGSASESEAVDTSYPSQALIENLGLILQTKAVLDSNMQYGIDDSFRAVPVASSMEGAILDELYSDNYYDKIILSD